MDSINIKNIYSGVFLGSVLTAIYVVMQREVDVKKAGLVFSVLVIVSIFGFWFVDKSLVDTPKPKYFTNLFKNFERDRLAKKQAQEKPKQVSTESQQCGMETYTPDGDSGCARPESVKMESLALETEESNRTDYFDKPYYSKPCLDCDRTLRAGYNEKVEPFTF